MKKRIFCAVLAAVIACSMIGCGGGKTDGKGPEDQSGTTADDEADAADEEADETDEATGDEGDAASVSDTVLWFNGTWAILSSLNGFDYKTYPGLEINETNTALQKASLEQSWDVTDKKSAEETLAWVMDEGGHREQFLEEMKQFEDNGISDAADGNYKDWILENYDLSSNDPEGLAQSYADAYAFYIEHSETGIAAWDYSRAMSLCAFYCLAEYYTEEEALKQSMKIAKKAQKEFSSWDEFYESYFAGYEYWAGESSDERRAVYEEIKEAENSPFLLDWNLTLEKTW